MSCYHPITVKKGEKWKTKHIGQSVPCNRCIGCRLERSRQWAVRIMNEAKMHKSNLFLTMTYRDEEIKTGISQTTGNVRATLCKRDLQLFWKRLRKVKGAGIRYFGCGEYGDKYGRPHYHACVFGLDFEDKKLRTIKNGNSLYRSSVLNDIWSHGHVDIGALSFESAAYVARYTMKKHLGKDRVYYEDEGITPEFATMSLRPGIGAPWLRKYRSDVYPSDEVITRKGIRSRPPRYYDTLLERENPELLAALKAKRKKAQEENPDSHNLKRLAVKERVKQAQTKNLTRNEH